MSIRIVAHKVAIIEPQHPVGTQISFQPSLNLLLSHRLVAVRSKQTLARCDYRTAPVALYRTAFEHEIEPVRIVAAQHFLQLSVYGVVLFGRKLHAPAVETVVEQALTAIRNKRDETVVARPSVVCVALKECNPRHLRISKMLRKHGAKAVRRLLRNDKQAFAACYLARHIQVNLRYPI